MNKLTTMLAAMAALVGGGPVPKRWEDEARKRIGRSPRATIKQNQRRWIARRHQDGIWRYDGAVSSGGAA